MAQTERISSDPRRAAVDAADSLIAHSRQRSIELYRLDPSNNSAPRVLPAGALRSAGLYLGGCWSEDEEGTCAVGLAVVDKTPKHAQPQSRSFPIASRVGSSTAALVLRALACRLVVRYA